MKKKRVLTLAAILLGIIFTISSCEQTTSTEFNDSFQSVKEVTPVPGGQDVIMDLKVGDGKNSFFTVSLDGKSETEAWCVEWNEGASFGLNEGTSLYSTKGQEAWKELNYFMSIKNTLRANDPELTAKDIQVIIWSLIEIPKFDVDKISEYEGISDRIYKDGEPLFDVQKVKSIVNDVKSYFASQKSKAETIYYYVTFVESEGQTIMTGSETAFAYGDDLATCFEEEIIEDISFPRWGWTNGLISDPSGELTFDVYAGAGQCDLNKGTLVGEVTVNYSGGTLTVTYKMTETSDFTGNLYTMTETHLYVGSDPYPAKNGNYTVAPGQYGNQNTHDDETEFTYEISGLSGDIYIIAHAIVNGFDPDDD